MTGVALEPAEEATKLEPQAVLLEKPDEEQETPSVFSVINRYLVGRVEVSPPAEDGSRIVRLFSGSGGSIIEANLSPQLCRFISDKLVSVEAPEEATEDAAPAD